MLLTQVRRGTARTGLVFLVLTAGLAAQEPGLGEKPDDRAVLQALEKANGIAQRQQAYAMRDEIVEEALADLLAITVQPIFSRFPMATAADGSMPPKFRKVTLNQAGKGFDGIRFKIPSRKPKWNLDWEVILPRNQCRSWNILAREGRMQRFTTLETTDNVRMEGEELTGWPILVTQPLHGGELKADNEYLIWFLFDDDRPADIFYRIALTATE